MKKMEREPPRDEDPEMRSWIGWTEYLQFEVTVALNQGSPAPGSWTGTGLWAAQQEACNGQTSKSSSALMPAPHRGIPA